MAMQNTLAAGLAITELMCAITLGHNASYWGQGMGSHYGCSAAQEDTQPLQRANAFKVARIALLPLKWPLLATDLDKLAGAIEQR